LALLKKLDKKFETLDKDLIHLDTSKVKTLNTLLDKLRG